MQQKEQTFRQESRKRNWLQIVFGRTMIILVLLAIHFLLFFAVLMKLTAYLPYLMGGVTAMTAVMFIYILNTRDDPTLKLSWCVLVALAPVFGVMLYFFVRLDLGHRMYRNIDKRTVSDSRQYAPDQTEVLENIRLQEPELYGMARYLDRYSGLGICKAQEGAYYPVGERMLSAMLEELEKAEKFIFLEYFIISEGVMWDRMLEVLRSKAAQGVEVRVLYDGTCSVFNLPYDYPKTLESMGIHCKVFSPLQPFISTHHNNRDHRKILVIDGVTAFTGGINLSDEYINHVHPYGHWKDTAVMVKGEAARSFTLLFLQMWNALEKKRDYASYLPPIPADTISNGYVIPFADTPTDAERVGQTVYMQMINQARDYVYIMTPYLILDGQMLTALCQCAKRGVDIRILQPHIPDHKYAYVLARRHYAELMEAGVKLYAYTPGFVHAKVFLADGISAVVGSINLDYRSLYLHYECGVYLYKTKQIREIRRDFTETFAQSRLMDEEDLQKESLLSRIAGVILKVVAPLM